MLQYIVSFYFVIDLKIIPATMNSPNQFDIKCNLTSIQSFFENVILPAFLMDPIII
jgi:hypothetical protein